MGTLSVNRTLLINVNQTSEGTNILAYLQTVAFLLKHVDDVHRYLRPSMLQHLLRRLVFDVPILNEYAKMPLKVWLPFIPVYF